MLSLEVHQPTLVKEQSSGSGSAFTAAETNATKTAMACETDMGDSV